VGATVRRIEGELTVLLCLAAFANRFRYDNDFQLQTIDFIKFF
jgi:hypothetical protein